MQFFDYLKSLLKSPSAFRDSWKKYARNQIGHALIVGALPVWFWGETALMWMLLGYPVWEGIQWSAYQADLSDAFEDTAFVLGSALITWSGYYQMFIILVLFLLSGILWRKSEADLQRSLSHGRNTEHNRPQRGV